MKKSDLSRSVPGHCRLIALAVVFILAFLVSVIACCSCSRGPGQHIPTPIPPDYDDFPTWNRAGDKITFTRVIDSEGIGTYWLMVSDTLGNEPQRLVPESFRAQWLPGDSEFIFFSGFKLYKMHLPSLQVSTVCDCVDARFPELDPTGRYLYYEDQGVANGWATSVYRMDLETGDTIHIVGGGFPSVSPDGQNILVNRHDSVLRYDLNTMTMLSGVAADAQEYDWTSDGQSIVYGHFYNRQRTLKIYMSESDGSNLRYLTTGDSPKCAPNSNRIAISRRGTDNKPYIWLIDQQGGNAKQITF